MKKYIVPEIEITLLTTDEVMFIKNSANASELENDSFDSLSMSDFFS